MRADRPKQYLPLGGRSILEHSLDRLLSHPKTEGLLIALAPDDAWWPALGYLSDKPLLQCQGGAERLDSVCAALDRLEEYLQTDALVLVHDAVRPFVSRADLDRLIDQAQSDEHGALLATPVADTLKRAEAGR
jgi:2-C-methyl-D-erythritol 4-phosphate cytidylyltransferase